MSDPTNAGPLRERVAEVEAALVMPSGPWIEQWQGSGPERGDHIMCGRDRVSYLPAADGTEGMHKQAGEIVYAHNIAVSVLTVELARIRAENEALLEALDWCVAEINRGSPSVLNARKVMSAIKGSAPE